MQRLKTKRIHNLSPSEKSLAKLIIPTLKDRNEKTEENFNVSRKACT